MAPRTQRRVPPLHRTHPCPIPRACCAHPQFKTCRFALGPIGNVRALTRLDTVPVVLKNSVSVSLVGAVRAVTTRVRQRVGREWAEQARCSSGTRLAARSPVSHNRQSDNGANNGSVRAAGVFKVRGRTVTCNDVGIFFLSRLCTPCTSSIRTHAYGQPGGSNRLAAEGLYSNASFTVRVPASSAHPFPRTRCNNVGQRRRR